MVKPHELTDRSFSAKSAAIVHKKESVFHYLDNFNEHSASLLLSLLISADLVFFAIQFLLPFFPSMGNNSLLYIQEDGGYPEMFQYLKWFWIIVLLAYMAKLKRSFGYGVWALIFTYFLCDDALRTREVIASQIAQFLSIIPPFGLRLQDLGELAVAGVVCVLMLILIALACWYESKAFRKFTCDMLLLIVLLAFFGVVADLGYIIMFHVFNWKVMLILGVLEEGGEMLAASLILWYVFLQSLRDEYATVYLCDFINTIRAGKST